LLNQSDRQNPVISRHRASDQVPLEKPNAWPNEPKPPRLTPEDDSEPLTDELRDDESPPKKAKRDQERPLLPLPPTLLDELRGAQAVPVCGTAGAAIPGAVGAGGVQLSLGISA
jgi:hypothetical protein